MEKILLVSLEGENVYHHSINLGFTTKREGVNDTKFDIEKAFNIKFSDTPICINFCKYVYVNISDDQDINLVVEELEELICDNRSHKFEPFDDEKEAFLP